MTGNKALNISFPEIAPLLKNMAWPRQEYITVSSLWKFVPLENVLTRFNEELTKIKTSHGKFQTSDIGENRMSIMNPMHLSQFYWFILAML